MTTLSQKVQKLDPLSRQQVEEYVDWLLQKRQTLPLSPAERTDQVLELIAQQPAGGPGLLDRLADPVAWQRRMRRDRNLPR